MENENEEEPRQKNVRYAPYNKSKSIAIISILGITLIIGLVGYAIGSLFNQSYIGFAILSVLGILYLLSATVIVVRQWDRVIVLRLGKYVGTLSEGIHIIVPIIDYAYESVGLRLNTDTIKAERTLTKDNVSVDIDAIIFWKVKSPEQAVFNTETYFDNTIRACQTALRDTIGIKTLSDAVGGRDKIGKEVFNKANVKTQAWGVEIQSIEIRDITIPQSIQESIARVAESEREKQARVNLAEAEVLTADKMREASKKYEKDPMAMQLRSLNMMYEISMNGKNQMIFIPTDSKGFSIPTPIGVKGIENMMKRKKEKVSK